MEDLIICLKKDMKLFLVIKIGTIKTIYKYLLLLSINIITPRTIKNIAYI